VLLLAETEASKYDFHTPEHYAFRSKKGLDDAVIRQISQMKGEPAWMLEKRLQAYSHFVKQRLPSWGPDLSHLDLGDLYYYVKPSGENEQSWDKVPSDIRKTFDKLGIPEAERKFLAGSSAQFESESVYHHLKKQWEEQGIIFTDMDTGLKEHPDIVEKYFGTVVPLDDNKFASLNSSIWSGGSFVYIPKNTHCDIPLQAYFRINTEKLGQFERTLIIAEEGSSVSYVEGCFAKGTLIAGNPEYKPIEEITAGDTVLTHNGKYSKVYHNQVRKYSGDLYHIKVWGNSLNNIKTTEEHPFLCVKRQLSHERNKSWKRGWVAAKDLDRMDYLLTPINKKIINSSSIEFDIPFNRKSKKVCVLLSKDFFKLAGYYLAEGSISSGAYLNFSFGSHERGYINEVKRLLKDIFGVASHESLHKKNHGITVTANSVILARLFSKFGTHCEKKVVPEWMLFSDPAKQAKLIVALFNGDGNYFDTKYGYGLKEIFRINTTSLKLAIQTRDMLLRLGIVSFINARDRKKEGRLTMYTIGVSGENMVAFAKLVGIRVKKTLNSHKRATLFFIDEDFLYSPIKKITRTKVREFPVYNFSVEGDESYVAGGVAVHNCSAPVYSTAALHAAVVEIIAKKNAKVRYTTIQNWSNNVYNLVTKRAVAHENAIVEWIDGNMGSAVTVKYPSVILQGEGARAEVLSVAYAGKGQHQDTGAKAIHLAPNTSSKIIQKSVCKDGGRSSFRGLVRVAKEAEGAKSFVQCNAYLLDKLSRSDTYPTIRSDTPKATVSHEAKVGKIGEDKLFYLMCRGIPEKDALAMVVLGFMESFTRELPMEYAVELNRLIQLQMEGAVG
jgi:Fe-S cluster assembly protein SufB